MNRKLRSTIGLLLCLILSVPIIMPAWPVPTAAASVNAQSVTVNIDLNDVVQSDFLGVGVNTIPTALMPGSTQYGYSEAHWEMDRKRIMTVKPKVARVWFQIDWMEKEKGVYDFDSMEMQALYRYLDAFKAAGTEIELNFGWKVGSAVHDWFVIPGVDPWTSAPADLDAYAVSASALLQELINERGYDNVHYLTFYNEPNGSWDFEAPGDQQAYFAEMVKKTSEQLTEDGLRDLVEIWGPEETGAPLWTKYMYDHVDDYIDGYSFHVYGESYDGLGAAFALRQGYVGSKPLHLTEFGFSSDDASNWNAGYANSVIQSANMGVKSALMWQLNGVWSYDPYGDTSGTYTMWDNLLYGLQARKTFYSTGLLMRYIPEHSEVLKTTVSHPDIARSAAFRGQDGEYTILLETKEGVYKDVTFDFGGDSVGKTFYKFRYQDNVVRDGQALLPASSATFAATDAFSDGTIDDQYNVVVYTTAAPQTQVAVTPLEEKVSSNETLQFSANVIDNTAGVTWSVVGAGNGSIDASTGLFTPPNVDTEQVIAIKAQSVADPDGYGIALVKVLPASRADKVDAPTIDKQPGVYGQSEAIYIETETADAAIYYTTSGETPTEQSTLYEGAVLLEEGKTVLLQARAFKDGLLPSGTTGALYKVQQNGKGPDGYTFCMYDNGDICQLDEPASVAYGADGLFNYVTANEDIACTSASFGGDPIPGTQKRCYYSYDIPEELPLATIYNAGFEKPNTTGTVVGPTTNGWTFNNRAGIQANGSAFAPPPAPEGDQSAYLKTDGGLSGEISQSIHLKPGTYQVEFQAAKRTSFGGTQTFDVYIGDMVIGSYAADTGEYRTFRTDSFTVAATGKLTLKFAATTTEGDNTAFIDAVRIVQPEAPQAPYLRNTGFEQPAVVDNEDHVLEGIASDWTFDALAGIVRNDNALGSPNAPFGVQAGYVKSGAGTAGSFSQSAHFPAGTYVIGFRAASLVADSQTIDIFAGDQLIDSIIPGSTSYQGYETIFFTVGEGEHTVRFAARPTEEHHVSFIDAVTIERIEIPSIPELTNGSFEAPVVSSGNGVLVGGTAGWRFNNYAGTIRNGSVFEASNAPDGTQAGYLQSKDGNKGEFSQSVIFPAGHYAIAFQAAKRTGFGGQQVVEVYLDNTLLGTYTPASGSFTAYETNDFVVETPSKSLIRFVAATETGDNTAFLDAITIIPYVPPALAADNAGFEEPAITSASGTVWNLESGWKFNRQAGMARNGSVLGQSSAPEGIQVAYLLTDGSGHGVISQTIDFPAGTYTMTYQAARRSYGGQQSFSISVGDEVIGSATPTSTAFSAFETEPFTVTEGSYTVTIAATTTEGDNTAFMDDIRFQAYIPPTEPVAENLGFESPEVTTTNGTRWNLEEGWLFNGHAGLARNGSVLGQSNAPEGNQVAYLLTNSSGHGEISQSILFPAGTYTMSFQSARRSYGGQQSFDVMVGNEIIASVTPASTQFSSYESERFTLTTGWHAVKIAATTTTGDNTAFVDQIAFHKVVPLSNDTSILSFTLAGQTGSSVIEGQARTIAVNMPYGTNLTALMPDIVLPDGATVSPAAGSVQNFAGGPVVYTVTAEDGTIAGWSVTISQEAAPPTEPVTYNPPPSGNAPTITSVKPEEISLSGIAVAAILIERQQAASGGISERIILSRSQAAEAEERAKRDGHDAIAIYIPNLSPVAYETEIKLPADTIQHLVRSGLDIEIYTANARLIIPKAALAESAGELTFRITPTNEAGDIQEIERRAKSDDSLGIDAKRLATLSMVGSPNVIERIGAGTGSVSIILPVAVDLLPEGEAERKAFLSELHVYTLHSDGSTALVKPEIVEFEGSGTYGLKIEATAFSTFAIAWLESKGAVASGPYLNGYPDGTFRPGSLLTRAELAVILSRLKGQLPSSSASYADVSSQHWAFTAIGNVTEAGLMGGYGDGSFRPERFVTRAEAAAIAARWLGLTHAAESIFADVKGHWAEGAINAVATADYMKGYDDSTFRPDRHMTRAEAAVWFNRLIGISFTGITGEQQWPDVPAGHWAYEDIHAATNRMN